MSIPPIVVSVNDEEKSLAEVCKGRRGVIDFWTTKCVRCPAALGKLNDEASGSTDTLFIACALSQGEGNKDDVMDFAQDWEHLTHVFAEMGVKEEMKKVFGFSAVPFYVVFDEDGSIVGSGEPKTFNYESALSSLRSKQNIENKLGGNSVARVNNVFTLDEDF